MDWTDRRARFRALLESGRCLHPASVFDPISARIAADLGFEMGMFAGSVASLVVLGAPDVVVLTLSEFAAQALRINRAGSLPLLVDADHGYGNALSVRRTVEELETAGVAGLTIEDTALPTPYGTATPTLLSVEEGAGKLRAAVQARQDKRLVIAGRTSAASITGMDDTIARARAYQETGVDALFFTGIRTRAELEALSAAIRLPILLGTLSPELADTAYLASQGVRIGLRGHQPVMAAIQATHEAMRAIRDGTPPAELPGLASPRLLDQVTRAADYRRWGRDFLGAPGD